MPDAGGSQAASPQTRCPAHWPAHLPVNHHGATVTACAHWHGFSLRAYACWHGFWLALAYAFWHELGQYDAISRGTHAFWHELGQYEQQPEC